jgi:hypothetical protein
MTGPAAPARSLASLLDEQAPLPAPRAAAVMSAVGDQAVRALATGANLTDLGPEQVLLHEDRSISFDLGRAPGAGGAATGVAVGACVGRMFFHALTGRPPLGADDAFEPHLTAQLEPRTIALLSSSCSDAPGQWPGAATWAQEFAHIAGPLRAPEPPSVRAQRRRRQLVIGLALTILALISVVVVLAAPGWWADATEPTDEGGLAADRPVVDQPLARS